ncbi:E3 SUMO-protein ligase ZBED1-like isoform X2 [Temnothorax longispinosus]|uniref:E3 SUMO-protein ligase ZBED1-like isoform X2 n=1 Tax=Temnothorax longispinosus TaxID=300112 RepID=UPI003A9A0015
MPKVKQSSIWKFFIKNSDSGNATCNICNREVKSGGKGGGTTNFKNHLRRNHAQNKEVRLHLGLGESENSNEKAPNSEQANNSNQLSISMPSTSTANTGNTAIPIVDLSGYGFNLATPTSCSSPVPSLSGSESRFSYSDNQSVIQPRIDNKFKQIKSFGEGGTRAGGITNAILFMIAKDNMPFQTVDNEGFRNLMKTIVPLYSVPGRKSITKKMEEKYEYLSACEKQKLEKIDYFSVTADIWTDVLNTISYLGITVHYEFEGELLSTTIGVTEMTERHTSEVIGRWMRTILQDWHIDDGKIVVVVTDNGANIKKAVRDTFGFSRQISCFAHSINLVAEDTMNFPDAITLCAKIKRIVTYFKQSTIAADALRKLNHLKLIQSVETRWNSTFAMLFRFISLSKDVGSILLSLPDSPEMLTACELQLAIEIVEVLQPLEKLTRELCGERFVTASKVIPLINCLKNKIEKLRGSLKTQTALALLDRLEKSITTRFGQIESNSIMATTTILDPRFKKLHFNQPVACSRAINRIARWMRELDQTNVLNDAIDETNIEISDKTDDLWSFHYDLLKTKSVNRYQDENDEMPTNLKHYLDQPMIDHKENPIRYWINFASVYPTLTVIAKKFLAIVGTSVPSERLFSRAGNILTDSRNRLSPDHLQHLLFLNSLSIKDWQLTTE